MIITLSIIIDIFIIIKISIFFAVGLFVGWPIMEYHTVRSHSVVICSSILSYLDWSNIQPI